MDALRRALSRAGFPSSCMCPTAMGFCFWLPLPPSSTGSGVIEAHPSGAATEVREPRAASGGRGVGEGLLACRFSRVPSACWVGPGPQTLPWAPPEASGPGAGGENASLPRPCGLLCHHRWVTPLPPSASKSPDSVLGPRGGAPVARGRGTPFLPVGVGGQAPTSGERIRAWPWNTM